MTSTPLEIPPGVVKRDSLAAVGGRWADAQWVRFRDMRAEKIGGWQSISAALIGLARGMLGWTSAGGSDLAAVGTHSKLYSIGDGEKDITPIQSTANLTDPFSTTDTLTTVTVAHTGHGRLVGSLVSFSGATAVGGITIDGEYTVTTVAANSYTIEHSSPATSTAGPGGGTVTYEYELNPGLVESTFDAVRLLLSGDQQGGTEILLLSGDEQDNGDGVLLSGDVGRFGVLNEMRYWSLDTYGSFLLAVPSGGTLYEWDQPNNDPRAVAVANAPASARAMFVTPERFPVMLGTTSPMTMQWPDQDDITVWTPASNNTANIRTLQNGSRLMAGAGVAQGISVVWSDTAVYLMQYTGSEFVYDTRLIADSAGLIAPDAYVTAFGSTYWLSKAGFLMYRGGGAEPIPNSADIRDFVLHNIDPEKVEKTWCGFNPEHNEIWWGYCTTGESEPNRYVMVNLLDFSWVPGALTRTAASFHLSLTGGLIMAGHDRIIYRHEVGLNAAGAALEAYIESGIVALKGADRDTEFFEFIPDFKRQVGSIGITLSTFEAPMSTTPTDTTDLVVAEGEVGVDTRLEGRYASIRLTTNAVDGDLRLGIPLLDTEPGGER